MTGAAIRQPQTMTVEQFLAWDGGGHVGKLELIDGVVRAMAPASATHSVIQGNVVTAINNHLRKSNNSCRAGTEAPIVPPMGKRINARAPDVAVTCVPPSNSGTFDEPVLIVEIMSPSDETETWETIRALAGLTSLVEIVIVQSTAVGAQVYRRAADGAWPSEPAVTEAGGTIRLESIGLDLPLEEVYRGTHLAA